MCVSHRRNFRPGEELRTPRKRMKGKRKGNTNRKSGHRPQEGVANGVRCHKRSRKRTERPRGTRRSAAEWPRGSLVKAEVDSATVAAPVPRVWAGLRW